MTKFSLEDHEKLIAKPVGTHQLASLFRMSGTTQGFREALQFLDSLRPDRREATTRWLLDAELARDQSRRSIVHTLFTRHNELRRKRALASLMEQFGG